MSVAQKLASRCYGLRATRKALFDDTAQAAD
jgi:hypothetical protein